MKAKKDGKKRLLPKPIKEALGNEVRRLRGDEILDEFAFRCQTDAGNISRIERGRQPPSLHTLYWIGIAAGVKMYQILMPVEGEATVPYQERLTPLERDLILAVRDRQPATAHALVTRLLTAENKGTPTLLIDNNEQPSSRHFGEANGTGHTARKGRKKKKQRPRH